MRVLTGLVQGFSLPQHATGLTDTIISKIMMRIIFLVVAGIVSPMFLTAPAKAEVTDEKTVIVHRHHQYYRHHPNHRQFRHIERHEHHEE